MSDHIVRDQEGSPFLSPSGMVEVRRIKNTGTNNCIID